MEYTSKLRLKKPKRGTNADPLDVNDLNENADKLDVAIAGVKIVTIPISGWIENQVTGGASYYTQDITVEGMTENFTGARDTDYVRPNPFTLEDCEVIQEMYNLIKDIESHNGYITVTVSEEPTTAFQIYLYGIE